MYNFQTIRTAPIGSPVFNASESSGFILFLPSVLFAVLLFTRVRRRLDPVAWALLGLGMVHILYCRFHFPHWLADLMLWSYTQGFRSQIAIGLISIVLSLYLLRPDPEPKQLTRNEWLAAAGVGLATAGFYLWIGASLQHIRNVFPKTVMFGGGRIPLTMQMVTALIALQALLLLLGKRRIFASLLTVELLVTAATSTPCRLDSLPSKPRRCTRPCTRWWRTIRPPGCTACGSPAAARPNP